MSAELYHDTLGLNTYSAKQASVHLLNLEEDMLTRISAHGLEHVTPAEHIAVTDKENLLAMLTEGLLREPDLTVIDLEPETTLYPQARGIAMLCPLVAGGVMLGVLHLVMPDALARYYLYNRVPMTLAHHAAIAVELRDTPERFNPAS